MSKRRAQVEQTRTRILDATMQLHAEHGILATSWEDIAERAGLSVGTVYRHFPTLDQLVPACGEVSLRRLELPDRRGARDLYAGLDAPRDRLRRLVAECYGRYERASGVFVAVRREREQRELPSLADAHRKIETAIDALVGAALEPLDADEQTRRTVRAICDFDAWRAFARAGLTGEIAVAAAVELLGPHLA